MSSADDQLELPAKVAIDVVGKTALEIYELVATRISQYREGGSTPASLRVDVLHSEREYLLIEADALASRRFLLNPTCPQPLPRDRRPYHERRFELQWESIASVVERANPPEVVQ